MVSWSGIRSAGNHPSFIWKPCCLDHRSDFVARFDRSLSIPNHAPKRTAGPVSSSISISDHSVSVPFFNGLRPREKLVKENYGRTEDAGVSVKLDEWVRDSVTDIVNNLTQAPLLVQIFANGNGPEKVKMDKAVPEEWPEVIRSMPSPDGIILVEELAVARDRDVEESSGEAEDGTKAWGVLIQGKGEGRGCGSACYLLKTTRVGGGLGSFCTHFCLVKVKNFRESALSQLNDCWLLP